MRTGDRTHGNSSAINRQTTDRINLTTAVQSFGQLGNWNVGVIHVKYLNRTKQHITFQSLLTRDNRFAWQLAPLVQLVNQPYSDTSVTSLSPQKSEHAEIQWSGPTLPQQIGYFYNTGGSSLAAKSYIYVRLDDPATVEVLTQAEYWRIVDSQGS